MALSEAERIAYMASLSWSFTPINTRADLVGLGTADGKTLAQAAAFAASVGAGFEAKEPEERARIAQLVAAGSGGVLDALVAGGASAPHTKIAALSVPQWRICLYLFKNGSTVAEAVDGAAGTVASPLKTEAVLYYLILGQDLATAKTSAGVA